MLLRITHFLIRGGSIGHRRDKDSERMKKVLFLFRVVGFSLIFCFIITGCEVEKEDPDMKQSENIQAELSQKDEYYERKY